MRRCFSLLIALALLGAPAALAQTISPAEPVFQAVITGPSDITVGRTVVLEASLSQTDDEEVTYAWYVNEGTQPISRTVEALYTPEEPGELMFRLVMEVGERRSEVTHSVTVYHRKIALVADAEVSPEKIMAHAEDAAAAGTFLRVVHPPEPAGRLGGEEAFTQAFTEDRSAFAGAEVIILWTDDSTALQALLRVVQADPELLAGMRNQTIMLVTGRGLHTLARIARGPYAALRPQQILVTRPEAISPLLAGGTMDEVYEEIQRRDIGVSVVNASTSGLRPWNALSTVVNSMRTKGVSTEAVILLLMLPVIATILTFIKQVIGITTFGLYTPSIIALSFLSLGWVLGIVFLVMVLSITYGARRLLRRRRMLYIPKVAIVITVVSVSLLLMLALAAEFFIAFSRDTIFILLVMSTLAESFLTLKAEEGWHAAVMGVVETVGAAMFCALVVQWSLFQSLILAYPEYILLTFIINFALGRWTGLRLVEYFRFREVFRHLQEE
jgi:hypothetical protein